MSSYNFESLAQIGERIRSYDFYGNREYFIEGTVIAKGPIEAMEGYIYEGYSILVDRDGFETGPVGESRRVGDIGYVPFQVSFMEYENRVESIS
jgi:hypothetical protein